MRNERKPHQPWLTPEQATAISKEMATGAHPARTKSVKPQSLAQEAYEQAWRIKRSLRR